MDEFELASEHEQLRRDIALRLRKPIGPEATGVCLHCETPLSDGRRWCDAECREDWEKRQRAERMRPRCE